MKKLIMALTLAAVLCGCERCQENAGYIGVNQIRYACINGHLYIANSTTYGYIVYTPLFAADSDVPMLIQCQKEQIK